MVIWTIVILDGLLDHAADRHKWIPISKPYPFNLDKRTTHKKIGPYINQTFIDLIMHKGNERKRECAISKVNNKKNVQVLKVSCHFEYNSDWLKLDFIYLPSILVVFFKTKFTRQKLNYTSIKASLILITLHTKVMSERKNAWPTKLTIERIYRYWR
jgi:hypothetical protein